MSGLRDVHETIRALDQRIEKLGARARLLVAPDPAVRREVFHISSLRFPAFTTKPQEETRYLRNGNPVPVLVTGMSCSVSFNETLVNANAPCAARFQAEGWTSIGVGDAGSSVFDFEWNYKAAPRQSLYAREFMSSRILLGKERGEMLAFKTPLRLNPGDEAQFVARPTYLILGDNVTGFVLDFHLWGYEA